MKNKPYLIILTGPESTAKSTLSGQLARKLEGHCYPEYARSYLQQNGPDYSYADVQAIAQHQLAQFKEAQSFDGPFVFFDTWLLITKIWFEWHFKKMPDWIEPAICTNRADLYLLCRPDIPWVPDPLRENGGAQRKQLFEIYKKELIRYQLPFLEVGGQGDERLKNALECLRTEFVFDHEK